MLHGTYDYFNIGIEKPEISIRSLPKSIPPPEETSSDIPARWSIVIPTTRNISPTTRNAAVRTSTRRAAYRAISQHQRGRGCRQVPAIPERERGGRIQMVITVFGLDLWAHHIAGLRRIWTYSVAEVNDERLNVIKGGKPPFLEEGLDKALTRHLNNRFHPISTDGLAKAIAERLRVLLRGHSIRQRRTGRPHLSLRCYRPDAGPAQQQSFPGAGGEVHHSAIDHGAQIVPTSKPRFEGGRDLGWQNNPEFLREGHCWDDFMNADRIVPV